MMLLLALACRNPTPEDDSAPLGVVDLDLDGDGFTDIAASGDDCDDSNADIHPGAVEACDGVDSDCDGQDGAVEVPYDGIDQDCDGADVIDADGDGSVAIEAGGDDCADSDPTAYPADGPEDRTDGVDNNCNGWVDESYACVDGSADFGTIQEAVDAAPDGSAVLLCPGTWAEQVSIDDRVITIRGDGAVPEDVVWDIGGTTPSVTIGGSDSDVRLQWMRMTGDLASGHWAIQTDRSAVLTIDQVDLAGEYCGDTGRDWGAWVAALNDGGTGGMEVTHSRVIGELAWVEKRSAHPYPISVLGSTLADTILDVNGAGTLTFKNNIFTGKLGIYHAAQSGEGYWSSGSAMAELIIEHNTFVALDRATIAIHIEDGGEANWSLTNNIYTTSNWAGDGTTFEYLTGDMDESYYGACTEPRAEAGVTQTVGANIVYDSAAIAGRVACQYSSDDWSELSAAPALTGALEAGFTETDPQFQATAEGGSYALSPTSPARDSGSGAADADGSAADIGAFGGPGSNWFQEYPWPLN